MFTKILASTLWAPAGFNDLVEQALLKEYLDREAFGTFVDVGANDPSNAVSRFLWGVWDGIIVEPLPDQASKFHEISGLNVVEVALASAETASQKVVEFSVAGKQSTIFPGKLMDQKVVNRVINVQVSTLDQLLIDHGIEKLNFLSIDVEGAESEVLGGFDLNRFEVRLLLVEDWGRDFQLHRLLGDKGYKRVRRTGFNSWYVPAHAKFSVSAWGQLQLFRKYVLSAPFKRLRKWRHDRKCKAMRKSLLS